MWSCVPLAHHRAQALNQGYAVVWRINEADWLDLVTFLAMDGGVSTWVSEKSPCPSYKEGEWKGSRQEQEKTNPPTHACSSATIQVPPASWVIFCWYIAEKHTSISVAFSSLCGCSLCTMSKWMLAGSIVHWVYSGLSKYTLRVLTHESMLTWKMVPKAMLSGFVNNPL